MNSYPINQKYRYPIRKRIEFTILSFFEEVIESKIEPPNDNDSYFNKKFSEIVKLYKEFQYDRRYYWYRYIRIMENLLSLFRVNRPGTYGHLLWIFLYISELSYFQSIRLGYDYKEKVFQTRESQKYEYWEEYLFNGETLNILFNTFTEIQEMKCNKINDRMLMCYNSHHMTYNDCKEEYKRIKSILYRDETLRKEFIYTKNGASNGNVGSGDDKNPKKELKSIL